MISHQQYFKFNKGFILLPVVFALTILAAVAYLLSREGAMNAGNVNREQQQDVALYVAQAGYNHAVWQLNRQNCTDYTDIPTTSIGAHSYLTTYTDTAGSTLTAGSPVNIKVIGTLENGASYTISRNREKIYQYPLTAVTLELGTDPGKDAGIHNFFLYKDLNYGNYKQEVFSPYIPIHQLIQFDLSRIPAGASIVSAQLELKQSETTSAEADATISIHRIKQSWVEGTKEGSGTADGATWKTSDGSQKWDDGGGGSYIAAPIASIAITSDNIVRKWDISTLVQGWHTGQYANEGLLLKGSGSVHVSFASKEDSTRDDRPKLTITYACECGVICESAKKIYWTDDVAGKIQRSDEDGSNVEDVLMGLNRPTGLDIDAVNAKLYWANGLQIRRADLDGSNNELLYSGAINTFDIKLDVAGGKMYWTHDNTDRVMRADLDGSNSETINTSLDGSAYITLDSAAGHIYLTEFQNGDVSRMDFDGSNIITIHSGSSGAVGNAIDFANGKIYWTGGATFDWIKRADLDGNNVETIVQGLNAPQDIAYDADNDRIYWIDALNKLVQRSDPDGTNVENIVSTGLNRPLGITLVNVDDVIDPLPSCFLDEFNNISFAGNDGTQIWTGDWQEVGEGDLAGSGDIQVTNDISNYQLRLKDNDNGGEGVAREADLSSASLAILSFDYRRLDLDDSDDYVKVEVSSSGTGGPWAERGRLAGPGTDDGYLSWSYTLEASEITSNTAIRLRTSSSMGRNDVVYFDNVKLQCSP